MLNGSESRREPRFAVNKQIDVRVLGPSQFRAGPGSILDISESGLSFTFRRQLEPGDTVTIEYEGCVVLGEVRHCRERLYANQQQFVIGLFVKRVAKGEDAWRQLIRQCCGR